ncbi:glycosyltransferase family 4 protein [Patescibacteria group bacterium]|nr:glycosyltransferase family 4 protein [Patescibacteria group bacterium]
MIIGIDCRMLGPKQAGLGRYVEQLIKYLPEADIENQYVLFLKKENWNLVVEYDEFEKVKYGQPRTGESGTIHLPKNFKKILANIDWYSWREQIKFKKIIKNEEIDLMHFPHWNVPFFYNNPFVVTIHDLIMYHYPRAEATTLGPIKFWLKDKAHRILIRHAVKKAKHIIVTSEFTKNDIVDTLGAEIKNISVIYQSPFIGEKKLETGNWKLVADKYGINKPFVLYVGSAYPHKNLEGLVEAWKIFNEKYSNDYQLVLAGRENYFYKKLKSKISDPDGSVFGGTDQKSVIITGFVPDNDLSILYQEASLYVFPSLYEGFGLPPLEAMAHDLPVVSSSRSCLPEVLGEAALYFDPENYEQMAEVIYQGLTDKDIRSELKQYGKENIERFSPSSLAIETLKIYNE